MFIMLTCTASQAWNWTIFLLGLWATITSWIAFCHHSIVTGKDWKVWKICTIFLPSNRHNYIKCKWKLCLKNLILILVLLSAAIEVYFLGCYCFMSISFYCFVMKKVIEVSLKEKTILLKLSNRADMLNRYL